MATIVTKRWPYIPVSHWQTTRDTVHLYTQVVGKVRLANDPLPVQLGVGRTRERECGPAIEGEGLEDRHILDGERQVLCDLLGQWLHRTKLGSAGAREAGELIQRRPIVGYRDLTRAAVSGHH